MTKWLWLAAGLFAAMPALAQDAPAASDGSAPAHRPRIGLVLGGGGARGLAHIGVLKVLAENHIPVDCVVGTSIGALVGGSYAAGQTADTMIDRSGQTDWNTLFQSGLPRQQMSYRQKQDDNMHLAPIDLGVKDDGSLALPKSAIDTQKIETLLRDLTYGGTARSFDDLTVPFRAIATDLETGEMVVMGDGDLVTAMRASMAVPGVFPPVARSEHLLVDGGLSRNLAVDVARKMCADVVIAVDVASPPLKRDGINTIFDVAAQYTRLMIVQNQRPQIASLKQDDVLITPSLGNLESTDFAKAKDFILAGEKATRQQLVNLQRYALPEAQYDKWEQAREDRRLQPKPIDSIQVERMNRVNPDVLSRNVDVELGKNLDSGDFHDQLSRLYARGDFSQLDYELLDDGAGQKLRLIPVEKDWGPNYLNFGIALGTDFENASPYALLARYRRTWLNALGAEASVSLRAGDTMALAGEFYQPLQIDGYAFIAPNFSIQSSPLAVYEGNTEIGQFRLYKQQAGVDLGSGFSRYGEARIGIMAEHAHASGVVGGIWTGDGIVPLPDLYQSDYGLRASFSFDQLDNADFPTSGTQVHISAYQAVSGASESSSYGRAIINARQAFSLDETSGYVLVKAQATRNGDDAFIDTGWLGGFLNLSSYPYQGLIGDKFIYGRLELYRPLPFLNTESKRTMIGLAAESGKMYTSALDVGDERWHYSGVGFIAVDSFLGPLYLGAAYGDNRQWRYYLTLGNPF
ncbi:patatin-like phospholipase family protein [Silvimonas amylolytica]|uniref:patatin-like phospholipase family protein n=1 Tax=Silvimonas amylolytica TaxID=449663 RepID=UPI00166D5603|nr:patatin-like phospholipase family protein [Silvimonas amylolytica]